MSSDALLSAVLQESQLSLTDRAYADAVDLGRNYCQKHVKFPVVIKDLGHIEKDRDPRFKNKDPRFQRL